MKVYVSQNLYTYVVSVQSTLDIAMEKWKIAMSGRQGELQFTKYVRQGKVCVHLQLEGVSVGYITELEVDENFKYW